MRRTAKDIEVLYSCYCRCWQMKDLERAERLERHGWVENVWVRNYDDVVRMSPTERGKQIATEYYKRKNKRHIIIKDGARSFLESI